MPALARAWHKSIFWAWPLGAVRLALRPSCQTLLPRIKTSTSFCDMPFKPRTSEQQASARA
eukprot:scaffold11155_cov141-Isochrysis_galbana.AAC.2